MKGSASRERFSQLLAGDAAGLDLAEAALLVACEEYPDLDVSAYLGRLDAMGEKARAQVARAAGVTDKVMAVSEYLFRREGFHGNAAHYYDPRNSFLNDVIDRRTGIPITLSAVYMEVGRRAGLEVQGVGFPGHFLVKLEHPGGDVVVDPYGGGVLLSEADCQMRLDRVYGGKVKLDAQMLAPVGPRPMLTRLLRNLKAIYARAADHERGLKMLDLLLLVDPNAAEDLRDRGLVLAELDCYAPAARDLEAYLTLRPLAPDAKGLQARVADLRWRATRLN